MYIEVAAHRGNVASLLQAKMEPAFMISELKKQDCESRSNLW
jgi:hypothetical protein